MCVRVCVRVCVCACVRARQYDVCQYVILLIAKETILSIQLTDTVLSSKKLVFINSIQIVR